MKLRSISMLALVLTLVGCGGGTVTIHPQEEGVRPPHVVIQDLARAKTRAERDGQLRALLERRGDHLQWTEFWSELAKAPISTALIRDNADALFALHARSCDTQAFGSFARFVQTKKAGWEYVLGAKRACGTALPPEQTISLLTDYLEQKKIDDRTPEELLGAIDYLNHELRQNQDGWGTAFTPKAQSVLTALSTAALRHNGASKVTETAVLLRSRLSSFPLKKHLRDLLVLDTKFGPEWIAAHGAEDYSRLLLELLTPEDLKEPWNTSAARVDHVLAPLWTDPFSGYTDNTVRAWEHYARLRRVLELFSEGTWPMTERLQKLHELQASFQSWFDGLHDVEAEQLVETLIAPESGKPLPDLTWFVAKRFDQSYAPRQILLSAYRIDKAPGAGISSVDRVLHARLTLLGQTDPAEKRKSIKKLCKVLSDEGIVPTNIPTSQLGDRLKAGIGPGCYEVVGGSGPLIESNVALKTSPDTVLAMHFSMVRLKAPRVTLGAVDMSGPRSLLGLDRARLLADLALVPNGGTLQIVDGSGHSVVGFVSEGQVDPAKGLDGKPGVLTPSQAEIAR